MSHWTEFNSADWRRFTLALDIMVNAHAGQERSYLGEPFEQHPFRVSQEAMKIGMDIDSVCAALLHDVVEDSSWTFVLLSEEGVSDRTVALVKLLTKWWPDDASADEKGPHKIVYYGRIIQDKDALTLKVLDRADNMRDMVRLVRAFPDKRSTQYKWARNYLRKTKREFSSLLLARPNEGAVTLFNNSLLDLESSLEGQKETW